MAGTSPQSNRLVVDAGGTNTRMALFEPEGNQFRQVVTYVNKDYSGLEDIMTQWLAALDEPPPQNCCIAAAAPPAGDLVAMINNDWSFSCRDLAERFGFAKIDWLNDFRANAHALPHLTENDTQCLNTGRPISGKLAVMGPGTGLGGATLNWVNGSPHACDSEPGHAGLSPATELELALFKLLLTRHSDIYAELLVSGPGLQRLYQALSEIEGKTAEPLSAADISDRALQDSDPLCELALNTFCALLGSACGDFVLSNGAYAGLFLAGGIIPRIVPFLRASTFEQRFHCKGAMHAHLVKVPLHVIMVSQPGLIGAAHSPL
jgi:glucokinase